MEEEVHGEDRNSRNANFLAGIEGGLSASFFFT